MRMRVWLIIAVFATAPVVGADEKPNPDELKKAYDDTLLQLKAAQNSKNDLARQNDKLTRQIEELRKELLSSQGQVEVLKREVSDNDQKTFELRSYRAAWDKFLRAYPDLMARWKLFLGEDVLAAPSQTQPLVELNPRPD